VTLTLDRSAVPFAAAGITPNETAAGFGADGLALTSPLAGALTALDRNSAAVALDSLSGEIYASTQSLLQQQSAYLRNATNARLRQAFGGGAPDATSAQLSAAPLPASGIGLSPTVWAEGFGGWDHFSGNSNAASLNGTNTGFLMGIDNPLGQNWRMGLAGGWSSSGFDVADRSSSGSANNYDIAVYGGARYGDLGIRLGAGYTWSDVSANRSVGFAGFGDQLSSSYNAGTAQVYGEVGYDFHLGETVLEPLADLAYVNLATDGFSETGGPAALTANSASFDTTYSVLGARISHAFDLGDGAALTATGRVGWQHAFGDTTPNTTLAFTGTTAPFSVSGVPISQNAALVEVGLGYTPAPNVTLGLYYSGQIAPNAQENSLNGTVALKF
jgi:outer membrane autotransporter protein